MTAVPSAAILVVQSRNAEIVALAAALRPLGETVLTAESADEAIRLAQEHEIAVAIVALDGPDFDGFELVETLRQNPQREEMPAIFASAIEFAPAVMKRVFELGTADAMTLPAMPEMLRSKVAVFAKLYRHGARGRARTREISAAASEVQSQRERFRLLMDAVSDYAIFFMDASGLITEWTASAERFLGYRSAEAVGQHFRFIFLAEDRSHGAPEAELKLAATNGQSRDDRAHVRRDGSEVPVSGRTIALKDEEGTLRGFAKIMRDATQTRALRDSETKFREIFETANEGIWILNADMAIDVANHRIAGLLGYEVHELVGRKKTDFVFPEDVAYVRGLFDERKRGKIQTAIEVRFRHRNGSAVWTLLSARPIYRQGAFVGALDMFSDITSRRLAEDRFRVFFESSAAGHALLDPTTGRFLMVNRRFCEISGRTSDELLTLAFRDITHPDDRDADEERFRSLRHVGEVQAEKRYVRPDGQTVWVHLTTTIVRDPRGAPEIQASVVQDITARKQAEAELIESRTRLRLAIDAAELGVFYYNTADGAVSWNDHMKTLLGLEPDEVQTAEAFLERVHPEDRATVARAVRRMGEPGDEPQEVGFEYRILHRDGSMRWLKANAVSERRDVNGKSGVHLVGTVIDATRAKEFEEELRRQIDRQTRELAEKTRQLENFCYTVAHDLRAPLRAINGYADYAREEIAGLNRPQAVEYLDRIRNSTRRLDLLITDLLAYSRITQIEIQPEPVDLRQVVDTVLHELGPEIERRQARVAVRDGMPSGIGEQSVLEQIVLNLVGNALKFSRPGEPPRIEIFAEDGDGRVRLKVRDHGIGIPREYHGRIFKVFERLQSARNYPGTGIGLAIVARGMERLGGGFGVESEPGHGSTFWIELKRADA